jgi:hypothetical protein
MTRRFRIAHPIRWTPDSSFRERDRELGPDFRVEIYSPTGELTECTGDVIEVLQAFGEPATVEAACEKLGAHGEDAAAVTALAEKLVARGFLQPDSVPAAPRPELPPAFLVSAHACGATLLRWFLDAHESIACAPPHRLAAPLRAMMERAGQTDAFRSLEIDRRVAVRSLARAVDQLLSLHASLRQKDGWVWASRDHDRVLVFLDDLFEGRGRFICLVRHPLDAAHNAAQRHAARGWHAGRMLELLERHDVPEVAYAHYWADVYGRVRAFRDRFPDRVLVVRYEDLVARPVDELARVCEFLGVGAPWSLVEDAFRHPHEVLEGGWESLEFLAAKSVATDQVGVWKRWPEVRSAPLMPVVEAEMRAWGYSA